MLVVTGAAGALGGRFVRRLIEKGYDVLGTDRVPFADSPAPFKQADLCDRWNVAELLTDAEAIVHMGAIPGPGWEEYETFRNNVQSTFNVLQAAADQEVRRVVFSSSAFTMGWSDDPAAFVPQYLPLDEQHLMMPFEAYGLSKQVGECIGRMIARSTKTSVASLRFTNVAEPEHQAAFPLPPPTAENPTTLVMWTYADPRDVARAHELALQAEFGGHEAFLFAQPITRFQESTVDLIKSNFGDSVEIRGPLSGNASVISTDKARRMLGFVPEYQWE